MSAVDTGQKQAGRFQKGQSGNPHGRPRGSRNAATIAVEILLEGQAEALTQKAIEMALGGDVVALRLCLERIYPARKDRPVTFTLPPITCARDAPEIISAIAAAVTSGDITPSEASEIAKLIDSYVRAYQTAELDERVARVEQLNDGELMRIAMSSQQTNVTSAPQSPKLLILNPR